MTAPVEDPAPLSVAEVVLQVIVPPVACAVGAEVLELTEMVAAAVHPLPVAVTFKVYVPPADTVIEVQGAVQTIGPPGPDHS